MADPVNFDLQSAKRISKVVQRVEGTPLDRRQGRNPPRFDAPFTFWAELTAAGTDDGWYSWKLIYPDPTATTGWTDADPAVTGDSNAREANDTAGLYNEDNPRRVQLTYVGQDDDGDPVYIFSAAPVSGLFPVKVSQTGGSNGSKTTAASWTYTVTALDGTTELGTAVAVVKPRPNGTMTAGSSYGVAFYDENGDLQLWDAGEKEGTGSCPS